MMFEGFFDACETLDLAIAAGGLSTSIKGIVPGVVGAIIGRQITAEPLTKPAKKIGDKIILVGLTGNDGNDTSFRASGETILFRPAIPRPKEEKISKDGMIEAHKVDKANACSDLGAAGIFAAICESVRKGKLGASVDLALVPLYDDSKDITPMEILFNETQCRFVLQVSPENVDEVTAALESEGAVATIIGEIVDGDKVVFSYGDEVIATIPNEPSAEMIAELEAM
jgi:phosphoribosylformylglycinamidine synthase